MLAPSTLRRHPDVVAAGLAHRGWPAERIAAILAAARTATDAELDEIAASLPNLPDPQAPMRTTVLRQWGSPERHPWQRPHWDLLANLGWLDVAAARRVAGPRFALLMGEGARLERRLANWMVERQIQQGYTEVAPPALATSAALAATGHLPHFADEMYQSERDDLWLNPTAEAPLVAMHAGSLLAERALPLAQVALLPSFRREAGAAGRQTRGLLRLHQFWKVELARIATPDQGPAAFAALTTHATALLEALSIPYRVLDLAPPELGFAVQRGRDIEAWYAGIGEWIEVASIGDCGTYQARRAHIRYQPRGGGRPRLPHTLHASGLAVGRTLAALVEQAQRPDGTVDLPDLREISSGDAP